MRRAVFALLISISSISAAQELPAWFTESLLHLPDDVAEAARGGKRVMLYFGQDGCPYCKQLMEVNLRQRAIADKLRRNFVALALNIWGDREVTWTDGKPMSEKQLAAMLKVQYTPTLLFLDPSGGVALRVNGYYPPHRFEAVLDQLLGVPASEVKEAANANLNPQSFFLKSADLRRKSGGKPLAVLFETPHCAACDELHAVAFKRQEVLDQLAKFDVARFALNDPVEILPLGGKPTSAAAWARSLEVGYVPTLVFFDPRGREVLRMEAYFRPFHVAGALEYVSSGAYRREPSFQRFLQGRAERLRSRGETVDLWN
ncbi:MAG TPA: thioredoxin fold domain-containing protein [Burkholderiales bacterium]|nr:thioredoxin fold domain-containing protein [Burkholderiales bacterium]